MFDLSGPFQTSDLYNDLATILWATTGALLAARRGYDITGVFIIALISSTGGGILRDGVFLNRPLAVLEHPTSLVLVLMTTVLVMLLGSRVERAPFFDQVYRLVDALGLGAFALTGFTIALDAGLDIPAALFIAVVNGVGGGLLRDMVMARPPDLLRPGTPLVPAALLGCLLFLWLTRGVGAPGEAAGLVVIWVVFAIEAIEIRLHLTTKPFREYREPPGRIE